MQVEDKEGNRGEFTVYLDGKLIAEKRESLPPVEEIVAAVRKGTPAAVGA
jgi:hypothetical protein